VTKELQKRKLISPKYVFIIPCFSLYHSLEKRRRKEKKKEKDELITRKHIHYSITKGPQFALEVKQLETDLTVEMLASYVPLSSFLPNTFIPDTFIPSPATLSLFRQQFYDCPFTFARLYYHSSRSARSRHLSPFLSLRSRS
jgi:hypothetical protein